jgi:GntR family transcriptional regulator
VTADLKHRRLKDHLLQLIDRDLRAHERLPTERDLASQFEVSRMTVRRALEQLESEGRVYRIQGAGTFVTEPGIAKTIELTSFSEDMRRRGLRPGSTLLVAELTAAGGEIGYALGLSPAEHVYHLERVRTADGVPMCVENVYLPAGLVPGLLDRPMTGSLYEVIESRFRIQPDRAEQIVRATVLAEREAGLLGVPAFSAALHVERTAYDARGRAVEQAVSTYRSDRYSYHLTVRRPNRTPTPPTTE